MFAFKSCAMLAGLLVACALVSVGAYEITRCDDGSKAKLVSVDMSACPNKTGPCEYARNDSEVSVRVDFEALAPVTEQSGLTVYASFDGKPYVPLSLGQVCNLAGLKCPMEKGQLGFYEDFRFISHKWPAVEVTFRYDLHGQSDKDKILCLIFKTKLV